MVYVFKYSTDLVNLISRYFLIYSFIQFGTRLWPGYLHTQSIYYSRRSQQFNDRKKNRNNLMSGKKKCRHADNCGNSCKYEKTFSISVSYWDTTWCHCLPLCNPSSSRCNGPIFPGGWLVNHQRTLPACVCGIYCIDPGRWTAMIT